MCERIDAWRVRELLRHRDLAGLAVVASSGGGWFIKRREARHD